MTRSRSDPPPPEEDETDDESLDGCVFNVMAGAIGGAIVFWLLWFVYQLAAG